MKVSDAPFVYSTFCSLFCIAVGLKNNVYVTFGPRRIYPNLWLILLGPSSAYRKTTSIDLARTILFRAFDDIALPQEFSTESLCQALSKRPYGAIFHGEFLTFFGMLNKNYMTGGKGLLADLFDSPRRYIRELSSSKFEIQYPAISIITASTTDWFLQQIEEVEFRSGFIARFILIPAWSKEIEYPFPNPRSEQVEEQLAQLLLAITTAPQGEMKISNKARDVFTQFYKETRPMIDRTDPEIRPSMERLLNNYTFKFAMLIEVNKSLGQNMEISEESMKEAVDHVNFLLKQLKILRQKEISFSDFERKQKKILKLIEQAPGRKIARSELLLQMRLSKRDLDFHMETLIEQGVVEIVREPKYTGKRPVTYYKLSNHKISPP